MTTDRYCIRDTEGRYLTHTVDVTKRTENFSFAPSAWMAYLFPDRDMAEMVAAAPDVQGSVAVWEKP